MSIFHAGNMIFKLILTIFILYLTIYIIKRPLKFYSCETRTRKLETTRKYKCNAESMVDLTSTIPTPGRKKSPIPTKMRQEFNIVEMTKRPQKAEEGKQ